MFTVVGTLLVFLFTLLFILSWQKYRYWQSRDVPVPSYIPLFGHFFSLMSGRRWENVDEMYKETKSKGYWGVYTFLSPSLFISDPALLREVLVKEADHFIDRRALNNTNEKGFDEMLTMVRGENWKALRALVSPTFTSGKIKAMFPLVDRVAKDFVEECQREMDKNSFVEIGSVFSYYTMEVIASCAFGIEANCLEKKKSSAFIKNASEMVVIKMKQIMKVLLLFFSPKLYQFFNVKMGGKAVPFFIDVIDEAIRTRKEQGIRRNDFLDLMLDALKKKEEDENFTKYPMTMSTVYASSILFLLAGFDTTSNALSFMSYLLAKNPEEQKKLRRELQKVVEADGELTYQNVMEAEYLEACFAETLRLYSPAHFIERQCTVPHKLSRGEIEVPEGMVVTVPIYSLHRDPEYWEEPLSFLPERFLPENKDRITPYTYLPWGQGPRNCIGMRFAQLEAKLVIAKLLLEYDLQLRPGFTEINFEKTMNILRPDKEGVQVVLEKISN